MSATAGLLLCHRPGVTDGRRVTLQLCAADGSILGQLPEFEIESPWWPDVEPVVAAVRRLHGMDVSVLRLIGCDPTRRSGGAVRYLAELNRTSRVDDASPLRLPWAEPGGVAAIVDWVDGVLRERGIARTGPVEQVKSWNLSMVLRIPTDIGPVWSKAVPPFMAHEGAIIDRLSADDPDVVPRLIGFETGIALMADIPGIDQFEAAEPVLIRMVSLLVGLQARWSSRVDELEKLGLPSWQADVLPELARDALERPETLAALPPDTIAPIRELVASLPDRLADLAACGLPDTLVHGDNHPGNFRSDGSGLVLLDWGDSGIGHPMLDTVAFLTRIPDATIEPVRHHWVREWQRAVPGSDPARAAELIPPIAALRQAIIYRTFLDGIEPAEHAYHEQDVPKWFLTALNDAQLSTSSSSNASSPTQIRSPSPSSVM